MDNDSIIYHDPEASTRRLKRGDLLIASPFMNEEVFSHSVVLLLDVGSRGGSLGLALNKKSNFTLQDFFPVLDDIPPVEVFCGGPVGRDRLFILHSMPELFPGSIEVAPGIFVGGDPDTIVSYLLSGEKFAGNIRFFIGYSGWEDGQLAQEIENRYWAVTPSLSGDHLLNGRGERYWRNIVESMGAAYRSWLNVPRDPNLN